VLLGSGLVLLSVNRFNQHSIPARSQAVFFNLGCTRDEILKMAGDPASRWDSPSGVVWDIYLRKTSANEYRISIAYTDDYSQSRLHPTERVSYITFELDHPRPVAAVLDDLLEARIVCPRACAGAVGLSGLIVAPMDAKAGDPLFFTMNNETSISSPIAELRLDKESSSPFGEFKPLGIVWSPTAANR
jgi:hypothetical protein